MSLDSSDLTISTTQTPDSQPLPTPDLQTSKKQKPSAELYQKTVKIAEKHKDKSWSDANKAISDDFKEAYPNEKQPSRSTRYRAHQQVTKTKRALQQANRTMQPSIKIVNEQPKNPGFLKAEQPIEELPSLTEQPAQGGAAEPAIDIEYLRDMLRGIHDMVLSKDGILGEKYGRNKEQVHLASDQLYRYLSKKITPETLENYDLPLLFICYAPLLIGILNDVRKERAKGKKQS